MAFEGPVDQLPSAEVAEFSEDDETETETSFDVDGAAQPQDYVDEVDDRSGSPEGNDGPSLGGQAGSQAASLLKPRSYQLEMLEKSLESNIIVAYVWFLAPTVALCEQQYKVLSLQLPSVQIRFLSGADKPELWKDQALWDAVLKNIRIVVSTHDVLLDALSHGFVRLHSLALLVFDEAHSCTRKHPANRIMQDFYHRARSRGDLNLPHVLGLSASPVMKSNPQTMQIIEQNLNALSKTPKIHHDELLRHTNRPTLEKLEYAHDADAATSSPALTRLLTLFENLDIMRDPYVIELQGKTGFRSQSQLETTIRTRQTYCQDQMKAWCNRSQHIQNELGTWATDFYIRSVFNKLETSIHANDELLADWGSREQEYLLEVLAEVGSVLPSGVSPTIASHAISAKAERLFELLEREHNDDFAGLIFVQQRAEAAVLSHLISVHPRTKDKFRCGTYIGSSTNSHRKSREIIDLLDPRDQKSYLDELRERHKNLIIATSVLEEGIDVSACHIVICFNRPANLKSFVQRRGRARRVHSKFVILVEEHDVISKAKDWESLEEEMKKAYMDDERTLGTPEVDGEDETYDARFEIKSTGALLTPDNAMQHLYHFCAVMPADPYVDLRPEFTIEEEDSWYKATLILPTSVPSKVRRAQSRRTWKSERMAKRDAAFEAFRALYDEGLVNDNLLPLDQPDENQGTLEGIEAGPSRMNASALINPWVNVSRKWPDTNTVKFVVMALQDGDGKVLAEMSIGLPVEAPVPPAFNIYWDRQNKWTISPKTTTSVHVDSDRKDDLFRTTEFLMQSVFRHRMKTGGMDFVATFAPAIDPDVCRAWRLRSEGCQRASEVHEICMDSCVEYGIVRYVPHGRAAYVFRDWAICEVRVETDAASDEEAISVEKLHVEATRWPRRMDLLHPVPPAQPKASISYLLAEHCEIDNLPLGYAQFAFCIPSILHRYEVYLIADELCKTILAPVQFRSLHLVITAISASSAYEGVNYQRMEFLGDAILKCCTATQLIGKHINWHEGYLSSHKDRIVSNLRLARRALEVGLDAYILTKPFTALKWRPRYQSDLLQLSKAKSRMMSSKVLADVVEALIGAAFLEGGLSRALVCMQIFLPELDWLPLAARCGRLYELAPIDIPVPLYLREVEDLIGHRFTKVALLVEAMTHPSYKVTTTLVSYQRLEYLGDAVLDQIVSTTLYNAVPAVPHHEMHLMRAALVNADFLAFLCMETSAQQSRVDIRHHEERGARVSFERVNASVEHHLWQFMRHTSSDIARVQLACVERYGALRDTIRFALDEGYTYPWVALSRLRPEKFFSDIIESVLGAIFIDSLGELGPCVAFLEKLGLVRYLDRILLAHSFAANGEGVKVNLMHPKQEIGTVAIMKKTRYEISKDDGGDGDRDGGMQLDGQAHDTGDGNGNGNGNSSERDNGTEPSSHTIHHSTNKRDRDRANIGRLYRCQLFVDNEVMAIARKGGSKNEAMTTAAAEALGKLRGSTLARV